jgi:uncharacterized protein
MLAIAIPVGMVIGLSLGALGGGGSILTVPALVYLLGQDPHSATMGSLLIVGVAAAAGTAAHWRGGRVRVGQGGTFGVLGVAGSYLGTRLSAGVDPDVLLTAFAGLMFFAAIAMLRRVGKHAVPGSVRRSAVGFSADGSRSRCKPQSVESAVASEEPAAIDATASGKVSPPTPPLDARRAAEVVGAATVVGSLTGFFGVGGGFVIVPVLVVALDFEMPVAVGTSLLVIALNSIVALAARRRATPTSTGHCWACSCSQRSLVRSGATASPPGSTRLS